MPKTDKSRRQFLLGGAIAVSSLCLKSCDNPQTHPYLDEDSALPVSPPGSESIDHFTQYCTACHLCVNECPSQVLKPTWLDYGIEGVFQPKLDFDDAFCRYLCVRCSEVCPTGAIKPISLEEKKTLQIGRVELIFDLCIVKTDKKDCGACAEHCPTQAVSMKPYKRYLMRPVIDVDLCVGCGACEYICPVKPHRAIVVVANRVHLQASKPETTPAQDEFILQEEFPF